VGSNLVLSNIINENGVKATPGSIPAPNSGSLLKKNTGTKMGQTNVIGVSLLGSRYPLPPITRRFVIRQSYVTDNESVCGRWGYRYPPYCDSVIHLLFATDNEYDG